MPAAPSLSRGIRKLRFGRPFRRLRRDVYVIAPPKKSLQLFASRAFPALPRQNVRFASAMCNATAAAEIPDMEGEIFAECGEIFPLPRSPTVARPTDLPKEGEEARLEGKIAPTDRDRPDARIAHNAMNTKASVGTNSVST